MIRFCQLLDAHTGALERHLPFGQISDFCHRPDKVLWVDVEAPTLQDLAGLGVEFGFHPLALEDCRHAHQRPKLDRHEGYMFLVFYQVVVNEADNTITPVEIEMFLGDNYVVTVHQAPVPVIDRIEVRWESLDIAEAREGAGFLAYLIVDAAVDTYFPAVDALTESLEDLEEGIFDRIDPRGLPDIFKLKRQTLQIRRLVTPLRDLFLVLNRTDELTFGPKARIYFQDIIDHLLRISDAIDIHRDLVSGSVDAYMSAVSNRTNEIMKKLTVLSAVLMSTTLIAGIYGMNFRHMPELNWEYGYHGTLLLMLVVGVVLTLLFKWRRYI